ncbi:hypothetical protein BDR26DRAFT_861517 [Obelidium mucronatum]|nr:hypothetical protein BDR26DRAFT_861517 [Obelidium mucronatum]
MNRFSDLSSISSSSSSSPSFYSKRCSYQELESGREIPESELQEWSEQEQEEEESEEEEEEEEEEADTPRLSHLTTSSGSLRSSRISISPIAVAVGSSSCRRGSNNSTAKTAFRASSLSSVSLERRRIDFESLFVVLEEDLAAAAAAAGAPQRFQRRGSEGSVLWDSKFRSLSNAPPVAAAGDTLTRRPTRSSSKNQQTIPTIFPTTTTAPNQNNSSSIVDQQQQLNDDQDTLLADEIVKLYASSRKHIPSTLLIRKDSIQVRRQSIQRRSILSANSATPVVPAVAPLVIQTPPPVKDSRVVSVAISEIDYDPIDSFIDCHMMDVSIENSRVVETKPDIQLEKEEQATSLKTTTSTAAGQPPSAIMSRLYGLLGNLEPSGHSSSSNNDQKDTSVTPSAAPLVATPKNETKPREPNQPKNLIKAPDFLQTTTTPNPPRNNLNPAAADIVVPKVSVMDRIKLFESNDSTTTTASSASSTLPRRKFAPVTAAKPTLVLTTPTTTTTTTTATTTNAKIDTLKTPDTPYPSNISINSVNDSQRPPRVVSILKKPRNALETTVLGGGGTGYQRRPYTKTSYSSASLPYYILPPVVTANRHMSIFSVDSGLVRRARTGVADNPRFYSMGRRSPTARIS